MQYNNRCKLITRQVIGEFSQCRYSSANWC